MNRSIFLIVAVLLGAMGRAGIAQPIVYSWTGTLERRSADNDPWGLGDVVTPFFISLAVNEGAKDGRGDIGDDLDLTLAAFSDPFDLTDAQFQIDGVPAAVGGGNSVLFFDFEFSDTVEILLENISFQGRSAPILSEVILPGSTFTFDENFESPPTFSNVKTRFRSLSLLSRSPYRASVEAGVTVTGAPVPEPSTIVLALAALAGAAITLRRNRNR